MTPRGSLLISLLALCGCETVGRHVDDAGVLAYSDLNKIPAIVCDNGELMAFSLLPAADTPGPLIFYPGDTTAYNTVTPSRELNVRLDVCVSPKHEMQLKRLVVLKHPDKPPVVVLPNRFARVKGLEKAVYDNDHSGVVVEIRTAPNQTGYLLKGFGRGTKSFVTFSESERQVEGLFVPSDSNLLTGILTYGDPWSSEQL